MAAPSLDRRLRSLLLAALLAAGCTGAQVRPGDNDLPECVRTYSALLRWGSPMAATRYVDAGAQAAFVRTAQAGLQGVRMLEVEIQGIQPVGDGSRAEAFVAFLFTAGDSIVTVSSVQKQTWVRVGKVWRILRAEPMTEGPGVFLFGEPQPE